ncbi:hypothetical protein TKK_0018878 [Trichogramma kaykai]
MGKRKHRDLSTSSSDSSTEPSAPKHRKRSKKSKKTKKSERDGRGKQRRRHHHNHKRSRSTSSSTSTSSTRSQSSDVSKRSYAGKQTEKHPERSKRDLRERKTYKALIGKHIHEDRKLAPALHSQFAEAWKEIIEKRLPDEKSEEISKKYDMPKNCTFSDPPRLNPEIKAALGPQATSRDDRIAAKQKKINTCLANVSKMITYIISEKKDKKNVILVNCINDLIMLLADLNRNESMIRKNIIMAKISPTLKETLSETKCGEFLFGEKLDEVLKSKKALDESVKAFKNPHKSGQEAEQRQQPESSEKGSRLAESTISNETTLAADNVSVIAGRLRLFVHKRNSITKDKTVLSWLTGYHIRFDKNPVQKHEPKERLWSNDEKPKVSNLINELINKGAIEPCAFEENQFVSDIFLRPKSSGAYRLILNLKKLNCFITAPHFKLEDGRTAQKLISENCFMSSLDLKDAYYLIPICQKSRKFLRFRYAGKLYQFTCCPFGLNVAPYTFTKLMKPVISHLRSQGFMSVIYLDDFLLIVNDYLKCQENVQSTVTLLKSLGFIVNFEKSNLTPATTQKFLGLLYDSEKMLVRLPTEKIEKVKRITNIKQKTVKIRDFARILGFLVSCCPAVKYGYCYTKNCERENFLALRFNDSDYNKFMTLPASINEDLRWWNTVNLHKGYPIKNAVYELEIYSDASLTGWGAVCNGEKAHGHWSTLERELHINQLELIAAFFGLRAFAKD